MGFSRALLIERWGMYRASKPRPAARDDEAVRERAARHELLLREVGEERDELESRIAIVGPFV